MHEIDYGSPRPRARRLQQHHVILRFPSSLKKFACWLAFLADVTPKSICDSEGHHGSLTTSRVLEPFRLLSRTSNGFRDAYLRRIAHSARCRPEYPPHGTGVGTRRLRFTRSLAGSTAFDEWISSLQFTQE